MAEAQTTLMAEVKSIVHGVRTSPQNLVTSKTVQLAAMKLKNTLAASHLNCHKSLRQQTCEPLAMKVKQGMDLHDLNRRLLSIIFPFFVVFYSVAESPSEEAH